MTAKNMNPDRIKCPEQERSLHAGPDGCEFVTGGQVAAGVGGDVVDVEAVCEEEHFENGHGGEAEYKTREDRAFSAQDEAHSPSFGS